MGIAEDLGCEVLQQRGEGKGAGMRQGFKKFLDVGDDELVMLDCDGTYHPEEITILLDSIPENGIVIGDRLHGNLHSDAMTSTNWIGNQLLTWLAVALHDKPIYDLCSGFWAFSRNAIERLQLNSMRFEIEAEMYTSCTKHSNRQCQSLRKESMRLLGIKDGASSKKLSKETPRHEER